LLQVPLQIGRAFTTAAQQSWKSPLTHSALFTLQSLIHTAKQAGITKGAGSSSLGSSIRQQLEQSGMLQQLAAVMTAAAECLQEEAAAYAAAAWGHDQPPYTSHGLLRAMLVHDLLIGLWVPQSCDVDAVAWLCHPSGHAAAGLQLTTAVLQHASTLVQHLLPGLRQDLPQQAAEVLGVLQSSTKTARALGMHILVTVVAEHARWQQQGQGSKGEGLKQLLLSPERLPYIAMMLVLLAGDVSSAVEAHSGQAGGSSGCGSGSTIARTGQQQDGPGDDSSGGSSRGDLSDTLSTCQQQLLQLLNLAPEMTAWGETPINLPGVCT
jgi:hypothetical protein